MSFSALPLRTYMAGETVLADGSKTDRLLILRKGNVAVVRQGIEIARVTEPGAVFGEISALLDCPHTADVCALENSEFHVAHAASLQDPAVLRYVAAVLARRLDGADQILVELTKIMGFRGASSANLGLYSAYSYDSSAHLRKVMISASLVDEGWA